MGVSVKPGATEFTAIRASRNSMAMARVVVDASGADHGIHAGLTVQCFNDGRAVADVQNGGLHVETLRDQRSDRGLQRVARAIHGHHVESVGRQAAGCGETDALRGAGDEGDRFGVA
ncbi:hypothetical protein QTI27_07405 [Variovorax sp. J31P216]|nr:hypothetical protein [Variovorax sp. J31P216]MDM0024351.1 hypothetical protein [Variovorax sp. J31P216]